MLKDLFADDKAFNFRVMVIAVMSSVLILTGLFSFDFIKKDYTDNLKIIRVKESWRILTLKACTSKVSGKSEPKCYTYTHSERLKNLNKRIKHQSRFSEADKTMKDKLEKIQLFGMLLLALSAAVLVSLFTPLIFFKIKMIKFVKFIIAADIMLMTLFAVADEILFISKIYDSNSVFGTGMYLFNMGLFMAALTSAAYMLKVWYMPGKLLNGNVNSEDEKN